MPKYCKDCGAENKDNSIFCRSCGKKLSKIHSMNTDKNNFTSKDNKILIGSMVVLLLGIAIFGTYFFVTLNNNSSDTNNDNSINSGPSSSVSDVSNVSTKSWHKIDSFSGTENYQFTFSNHNGNRIKVVVSAMPLKNYGNNAMRTLITNGTHRVGTLILDWDSSSAVAVKTDSAESSLTGTFEVDIATYELKYWNVDIYEYY